jgi:hypothetical protein
MPSCPYCGKEYPDGQPFCPVDGYELTGTPGNILTETEGTPAKPDVIWQPKLIDLSQVEGAFSFEEGYSRPDWKVISQAIQQKVIGSQELNAAWTEAARQWVMQLRSDLGGDYQVKDSPHFILLTALDSKISAEILSFAENTLDQICARLKDAAWTTGNGKHVILLFQDKDDYYQYVSYYYREGNHPTTGGCLIHKDYVHIAAPYEPFGLRRMLAHELTHNCVVHLKLPLWLNEGLAMLFERTVAATSRPMMDYELKERHLAFWNPDNIQEFWSGISFQKPGDSNELSYSLSEIMLTLLMEQKGDWGAFLKQADWGDAGQTAAIECLGSDLGNVMSTFLGEGDWRPRRKVMIALWEAKKKSGLGN